MNDDPVNGPVDPPPPPPRSSAGWTTAPDAPAAPAPEPRGSGGASATTGIVLVVVGLVILLIRFVPSVSWWSFWPLVVVLAGLVQAFTPGKEGWSVHRLFDGFVTVAIGGVLLANTMGIVGWSVWLDILSLWPVLLIAIGFDLLGKAMHTSWLRAFGSLAIIGALAYAVATAGLGYTGVGGMLMRGPSAGVVDVAMSERVGMVRSAKLTLDSGVATVRVDRAPELIAITGTSPFGQPTLKVDRSGTTAQVDANLGSPEGASEPWSIGRGAQLEVGLSDAVVWDVRMNTGVSSLRADFSEIPVRSLDLRPGVADCDVRLGAVPEGETEARAEVRAGVSSVTLRLPENVDARVEIESGISSSTVRGGLEKTGSGVWVTPGFEAARSAGTPVWTILVRSGVGSVTIDTY